MEGFRAQIVGLGADHYHHGVGVGFDEQSHRVAKEMGLWVVGHPPVRTSKMADLPDMDEVWDPMPYLDRDRQIVLQSDVVVACPREREEQVRSGTWAAVREARRLRRPLVLIFPTGEVDVSAL